MKEACCHLYIRYIYMTLYTLAARELQKHLKQEDTSTHEAKQHIFCLFILLNGRHWDTNAHRQTNRSVWSLHLILINFYKWSAVLKLHSICIIWKMIDLNFVNTKITQNSGSWADAKECLSMCRNCPGCHCPSHRQFDFNTCVICFMVSPNSKVN